MIPAFLDLCKMSFIQKLLLGGIALVLAKGSSASFYKRESDASFSLYTYGAFSGSGARVFFADGKPSLRK